MRFKKFHSGIDTVDYDDLDNYYYNYMMMVMMMMMMMNTEKLEALEDYLKGLIEIITNQEKPMMVLQEEKIITSNIRVKEIDTRIYHRKNILI